MNKSSKASITIIGIAAILLLLVGCSSSSYSDLVNDVLPEQQDTGQLQATQIDNIQDDVAQDEVVQNDAVDAVDAVQDDAVQNDAVNTVQDDTVQDDTVQDGAIQNEVVQDDAIQNGVVQDDATQKDAAHEESTQEEPQQESVVSISSPVDVRGTQVGDKDVKWEWAVVPNASSYEVYLDGIFHAETQDDFLYSNELSGSEHSVTVVAVDSEGRRSIQSESAVVTLDSDLTVNSGNAAPPPVNEEDNGLIDPSSWSYNAVYEKPGYSLVFSDEFDGNSLNRARWNTNLRWDGSFNGERYEYRLINGEAQYYVNIFSEDQEHLDKVASVFNPFELDGNRLAIRSIRNPLKDRKADKSHGPLHEIATQQPFLSGAMSTYGKFYRKYGYFEARIKIPAHLGTFPAFWLHHQNRENEGTQRTEIDIMENLGHAPWYVYNAFHYFTGVSEGVTGNHNPTDVKIRPDGQIHTGIDYSDDYHVYAVEWSPGKVRYFIDGQEHNVLEHGAVDFEELYININLAVGGDWTNRATNAGGTGRAAENNPFPSQQDIDEWQNPALEIDYVRVYAPD